MTTIREQLVPLRALADRALLALRCAALGLDLGELSPEQREEMLSSIAADRAAMAADDEARHEAYIARLAEQDIDGARRESVLRARIRDEVPPAFQRFSYEDLLPQQRRAADAVLSGRSGYIRGLPGTGKTTVAWAVCVKRWSEDPGDTSSVILLPPLLSAAKASADWIGYALEATSSQPLLFIDEVGRGRLSDKDAEVLFSVIDRRDQLCLQTVLLSNARSKQALAEAIGEAAFSRVASGVSGVLDGSDLRIDARPDASEGKGSSDCPARKA